MHRPVCLDGTEQVSNILMQEGSNIASAPLAFPCPALPSFFQPSALPIAVKFFLIGCLSSLGSALSLHPFLVPRPRLSFSLQPFLVPSLNISKTSSGRCALLLP